MVCRFSLLMSAERSQSAISGAIGVTHQIGAASLVQQNGHPHLLQNEIALKIIARRCQSFGAAGDNNHVRTQNGASLQKLIHRQADALIEAAEHRSIGCVRLGWGIEVEDFSHSYPYYREFMGG